MSAGGIFLLCNRIFLLVRTSFPASPFKWWLFYQPLLGSLILLISFTGICMGLALPNEIKSLFFGWHSPHQRDALNLRSLHI
jgi:hypothetical protein